MKAIDFVITWVDGDDPVLAEKRSQYKKQTKEVDRVAAVKRRFSNDGEIFFCLKSMFKYASWVRKVWIITDGQKPDCLENEALEPYLDKIEIVDHTELFSGYEKYLPTFNSLSIETFLWRIEDLSEQFVYFNDDFFLAGKVGQRHFFRDGKPVLRGSWGEWLDSESLSFHGENRQLGAELTPFQGNKVFRSAHVFYPLKKSVMSSLFLSMQENFLKNASFKFRSRKQFWPISLHNHALLATGGCVIKEGAKDWVHFSVAFCKTAEAEDIEKRINLLFKDNVVVGCLNYIGAVAEKYPDIYDALEEITS